MSVLLQMVAYDGQLDGLFRGAVMVYSSHTRFRTIMR